MSPARLRAYVLIVMRDVVTPGVGVYLCVYLPTHHLFAPWQLPLLAGLFGVPLVGRDSQPAEDERPETRPPSP